MTTRQSGFTLIEIMIVITIISILGAMGFSTYRRAVGRAQNTRKTENIKVLTQAIAAYVIDNGSLPAPLEAVRNGTGSFTGCLGQSTRDVNSNGLTDCDVTSASYEESAALNTALQSERSTAVKVDDTGVSFGALGTFWGATLVYLDSSSTVKVNGTIRRLWLNYALQGQNQTCDSFSGIAVDGGSAPDWTSSSPINHGLQVNGNTMCYVALTQEFGR